MANKKQKKCEYFEFLPEEVQKSKKLNTSEKNVLAVLCFEYLAHSNYANEHNGWFYRDARVMSLEAGFEDTHDAKQFRRIRKMLEIKNIIRVKSGTHHTCNHYKINPKITDLLPKQKDLEWDDFDDANVLLE